MKHKTALTSPSSGGMLLAISYTRMSMPKLADCRHLYYVYSFRGSVYYYITIGVIFAVTCYLWRVANTAPAVPSPPPPLENKKDL